MLLFIQVVSEWNLKLIFSETVVTALFIQVTTLSCFLISIPFLLPVLLIGTLLFYFRTSFKFGIFHALQDPQRNLNVWLLPDLCV